MASNNLPNCLPTIFANEGGFQKLRSDKGNYRNGVLIGTKYGIAAASHPDVDIVNLTKDQAAEIYAREYWTPAGCEALPAGLDLTHLDADVNSGRSNSTKWLAAARKASADTSGSIHAYAAARLHSYESFKAWATFGKVWASRIARVEAVSIAMALGSVAPATIAATASKADAKASAATAAAHVGTGAAVVSIATAVHAHPVAGGLAALASVAWSILASFYASASSARAATLKAAS